MCFYDFAPVRFSKLRVYRSTENKSSPAKNLMDLHFNWQLHTASHTSIVFPVARSQPVRWQMSDGGSVCQSAVRVSIHPERTPYPLRDLHRDPHPSVETHCLTFKQVIFEMYFWNQIIKKKLFFGGVFCQMSPLSAPHPLLSYCWSGLNTQSSFS